MRGTVSWVAACWIALAAPALAQRSYVQIEAHQTLAETTERARAYAGLLPNVNGFDLSGRWYGIALGPYDDPRSAEAALRDLRAQGLIPRDSYVTAAGTYLDRVWPAGADATVAAPPAGQAAPPAPPDESPQDARRSEALLTAAEREDLQRALQWFGFYDARIDGAFGRGTRASMAAWQAAQGMETSGILTTRQRAELLADWRAAQAAIGLEPIQVAEAGIALTAPMGLVAFDRVEAPFVHYAPRGTSGVSMALMSQRGDPAALGGLYEILQTLDVVPVEGPRERGPTGFRIRGADGLRTTQIVARLDGDHVLGFLLSWPPERARDAERALEVMEATLASTGRPLDAEAGFEADAQSLDTLSGLEIRRPLRAASGFFVDADGAVVAAADIVAGCGRVTLEGSVEAAVVAQADGAALLRPRGPADPGPGGRTRARPRAAGKRGRRRGLPLWRRPGRAHADLRHACGPARPGRLRQGDAAGARRADGRRRRADPRCRGAGHGHAAARARRGRPDASRGRRAGGPGRAAGRPARGRGHRVPRRGRRRPPAARAARRPCRRDDGPGELLGLGAPAPTLRRPRTSG